MKRLVQVIVFILLIAAFIYLGSRDYKDKVKQNKKSNDPRDVLISDDTVFIETNHSKILSKLSTNSSFILYACINENKLCSKYGMLIDEIAKNYEINDVYYYDFKQDRDNNNGTYQKIISKLDKYLLTDDLGEQDLHAPTLIFVKNGSIYAFDDSLSSYHGNKKIDEVWNEETINYKREYLIDTMEGYLLNE